MPGALLGPLLRGIARDEDRSIHQMIETVVRARDDTLWKKYEGAARIYQYLNRAFQRVAIHPFAIHAENPRVLKHPLLKPTLHEEMPARHDVNGRAHGKPERIQHHRIARSAMVRRQHDSVPGLN